MKQFVKKWKNTRFNGSERMAKWDDHETERKEANAAGRKAGFADY